MDQEVVASATAYALGLVAKEQRTLITSRVPPFWTNIDVLKRAVVSADTSELYAALALLLVFPSVGLDNDAEGKRDVLLNECLPLLKPFSAEPLWKLVLFALKQVEESPSDLSSRFLSTCTAFLVKIASRAIFSDDSTLDIRDEPHLSDLLLRLLNSPEGDNQRAGLFLLKQVLKQNTKSLSNATNSPLVDAGLQEAWAQFVLLYVTCREKQVHLLKPLFPKHPLAVLANLGCAWWQTALRQGLVNPAVSVRRLVIQRGIFALVQDRIRQILSDPDGARFLLDHLVALLGASSTSGASSAFLYTSATDAVNLASAFGERVADFYERVLEDAICIDAEMPALFINSVARHVVAAIPLFYLLRPMSTSNHEICLPNGNALLDNLAKVAASRGLHNRKARTLVHWQCCQIAKRWFANRPDTSIRSLCEFVVTVSASDPSIYEWLRSVTTSDDYLVNVAHLAISRVVESGRTSEELVVIRVLCQSVAKDPKLLSRCIRPVQEALENVSAGRVIKTSLATLVVLVHIAMKVEEAVGFPCIFVEAGHILDVCHAIEDQLFSSFINSSVARVLSVTGISATPSEPPLPLDDYLALLDAFGVLALRVAALEPHGCRSFLDLVVKERILPAFPPLRPSHLPKIGSVAPTIDAELAKLVNIALLARAADVYHVLEHEFSQEHPLVSREFLASLTPAIGDDSGPNEIARPVYLTEAQWFEWPVLEQRFEAERFRLLQGIARLTGNRAGETLTFCLDRLAFCKHEVVVANLNCIQVVLESNADLSHLDTFLQAFCQSVRDVLSGPEASKWAKAYGIAAIDTVCINGIVNRHVCIRELLDWIIDRCESRMAVLVVHISRCLSSMPLDAAYAPLIARLLTFGPPREVPEEKLAEDIVLGADLDFGSEWHADDDCMARVYQLNVINSPSFSLVDAVADALFARLDFGSVAAAEKLRRCAFPNSAAQRSRLRAWMALLVLSQHWNSDQLRANLLFILDRLLPFESLPEVRHFAEWTVFECVRRSGLAELVFERCRGDSLVSLSPGTASSLISILVWITKSPSCGVDKARSLTAILPLFLHNSAEVRMRTFWAFDAIARLVNNSDEAFGDMLRVIRETRHGQQFLQKMLDRAIMQCFDPEECLSLTDILNTVPRLTQSIAADELVSEKALKLVCSDGMLPVASVKHIQIPAISSKVDEDDDEGVESSSFQQKTTMSFDDEDSAAKSRTPSNLVIVASLLDRVPNMAALCRTAEVLGADELVLADASVVATRDFASVCMTADRWIPITQVVPDDLPAYISRMQSSGYSIIAVEQSSTSKQLHEFTFPDRIVLLLGNELEGVRADLLQLCDACVEIPQGGVIRSLNVHVAASLVIWEIVRKRSLASK